MKIGPKIRPGPTQIPKFFGPFWSPWGQTNPIISSASRFRAGCTGPCPDWSRERPNQPQNHVLAGVGWSAGCKKPLCFRARWPPAVFSQKSAPPNLDMPTRLFLRRVFIIVQKCPKMFRGRNVCGNLGLPGWPWLAWLSSPRIGLARLACTSNNSPAALGGRAAQSSRAKLVQKGLA